nr:ATP-binding protein [uncultured Methanospirillum sp.]
MDTQTPDKSATLSCDLPPAGTIFQVLPDEAGTLQVLAIIPGLPESIRDQGSDLTPPPTLDLLLPLPAVSVIRDLIDEATGQGEVLSGYVPCGREGQDIRVMIARLSDGTVSVTWGDKVSLAGGSKSIHLGHGDTPDVISRHDQEFIFSSSTPSSYSLFGLRPSELSGTSLLHYVHPEDLLRVKSCGEPLISGPGVCRIRYRLRNHLNEYRWVESVFTSTFRSDNTFSVMMASTREMDTIVRAEQAARGANAKLNLLNGIMRHDIMNQLTGLIGYLDILAELVKGEEAELLISKEQNIAARIKYLVDLTRDYQGIGLHPPDFMDVDAVVYKVLSRHEFAGKIRSDRSLSGVFIYVDRMFEQVVFEIVSNSHIYGGEQVTVSFSYEVTGEGLTLIIEDNGPGIAETEKERIFSRTGRDSYGHGLYMATEILDLTGIRFRETGTAGHGARFEILVPRDGYRVQSPG